MLKNNESTIDKPLQFFNHFICEDGYITYKKQFFSGLDLETFGFPVYNVNKEIESYSYDFALENGEVIERKVSLSENLKTLLKVQGNNSFLLIAEKIKSLINNGIEPINFLKLIIAELNYLSDTIKNKPELLKINVNLNIYSIVNIIRNKYNPFFVDIQSPIIAESLKYLNKVQETVKPEEKKSLKQKDNPKITTFKFLSNQNEHTLVLFEILKNKGFLYDDSQTQEKFKIAFNGSEIYAPLNIKWNSLSKKSNVASLVRFIKLLSELKIIEHLENSQICKILEYTFIDTNESPFVNLGVKVNEIPEKPTNIIETQLHAEIKSQFSDK